MGYCARLYFRRACAGTFVHNVDFIHHLLADYQLADGLLGNVATLVVGVIVGAIACAIVLPAMKLFGKH